MKPPNSKAGAMPNVNGVLETSLYVEDLKRSIQFYKTLFGFELMGSGKSRKRMAGFVVANRQVLLLFKKGASTNPIETPGGTVPPNDGDGNLHLAFSISASDLEHWEKWLGENGVSIESKAPGSEGAKASTSGTRTITS